MESTRSSRMIPEARDSWIVYNISYHIISYYIILYYIILYISILHIILYYIKPCYIIPYCQTIVAGKGPRTGPRFRAPKSGEKVSEHSSKLYLISWQIYGLFTSHSSIHHELDNLTCLCCTSLYFLSPKFFAPLFKLPSCLSLSAGFWANASGISGCAC